MVVSAAPPARLLAPQPRRTTARLAATAAASPGSSNQQPELQRPLQRATVSFGAEHAAASQSPALHGPPEPLQRPAQPGANVGAASQSPRLHGPPQLDHKALNRRLLEQRSTAALLAIVADAGPDLQALNMVNKASAFFHLAKLAGREPVAAQAAARSHPATRALVASLERELARLGGEGMKRIGRTAASILYAHALLGHGSEALVQAVLAVLDDEEVECTPQDAMLLTYAMARLQRPHAAFLRRLSEALLQGPAPARPATLAQAGRGQRGQREPPDQWQGQQQQQRQPPPQQQQPGDGRQTPPPPPPPPLQQQQPEKRQQGLTLQGSGPLSADRFPSKDLCLLAWSLGELGAATPALLLRLADAVASRELRSLSVQAMCMLLQALAGANLAHEALADAVAAELAWRPRASLSAQDLSGLAHGLATLWQRALEGGDAGARGRDGRMAWQRDMQAYLQQVPARGRAVALLAARASELVPVLIPKALAALCWSFATLGLRGQPALMDALAERAIWLRDEWDAHGVSSLAWSYSALAHDHPPLLEALAYRTLHLLGDPGSRQAFSAQAVAMTVLAFGSLNRAQSAPTRAMLSALAGRALEVLPDFTSQGLSNLAWGLAAAACYPPALLRRWRVAAGRRSPEFGPVELSQLHLVEVALQLEAPHICSASTSVAAPAEIITGSVDGGERGIEATSISSFFQGLLDTGRLRGQALRSWTQAKLHGPATVTHYQRQVYEAVHSLVGDACKLEWRQPNGDYSIDIALPEQRIAIEADGPFHYASNSHHLLGYTALKRRLLGGWGWSIVDVPYFDWQPRKTEADRRAYIAAKLQAAGLEVVPDGRPLVPGRGDETSLERQRGVEEQEVAAAAMQQLQRQQDRAASFAKTDDDGGSCSEEALVSSSDEAAADGTALDSGSGSDDDGGGSRGEEDEQADAVQARLRRLALMKYAKGQVSRQGLAAKEAGLRVAETLRRKRAAGGK